MAEIERDNYRFFETRREKRRERRFEKFIDLLIGLFGARKLGALVCLLDILNIVLGVYRLLLAPATFHYEMVINIL